MLASLVLVSAGSCCSSSVALQLMVAPESPPAGRKWYCDWTGSEPEAGVPCTSAPPCSQVRLSSWAGCTPHTWQMSWDSAPTVGGASATITGADGKAGGGTHTAANQTRRLLHINLTVVKLLPVGSCDQVTPPPTHSTPAPGLCSADSPSHSWPCTPAPPRPPAARGQRSAVSECH